MSKKKERVKNLIGIRNALNENGQSNVSEFNQVYYEQDLIKQILKTIDSVLVLDGVHAIDASQKLGE